MTARPVPASVFRPALAGATALWLLCSCLLAPPAMAETSTPFFRILYPENETSFSGAELVEFKGKVGEGCESVRVSYFDAQGRLIEIYKLRKYLPGSPEFVYRAAKSLGNLAMGSNRYLFEASFPDGVVAKEEIVIYINEHQGEKAKPVIYLYPALPTEVRVRVAPVEGLSKSEPAHGEGWRVTAYPDGRIVDGEGKEWPWLFWESPAIAAPEPLKEGFVVRQEDLLSFLVTSLATLGLDERETSDFLEFWLPLMKEKPWYAVRFWTREEIDSSAPLSVDPAPDSVIRILMDYRGLEAPLPLAKQHLEAATRKGFAVVEWGGMHYR